MSSGTLAALSAAFLFFRLAALAFLLLRYQRNHDPVGPGDYGFVDAVVGGEIRPNFSAGLRRENRSAMRFNNSSNGERTDLQLGGTLEIRAGRG